jgi:hypothetical protein
MTVTKIRSNASVVKGLLEGDKEFLIAAAVSAAAIFFSQWNRGYGLEPKAARSLDARLRPSDRRASHKLATAAPSDRRARATGNFVHTSTLGKIRSWLKAVSFSRAVVTAQWQSGANLKEIDKWKI